MKVATNANYRQLVSNHKHQLGLLQQSMQKLSKGEGEVGPAELGITERFRNQIRSAQKAGEVIQNAMNIFQSTDAWLSTVNDILNRMTELAASAVDSSKNPGDLKACDRELQQLKDEIVRMSEQSKFNGLSINSKTSVCTYDTQKHKLVHCQADGSDPRSIEFNLKTGNSSKNGIKYCFENATGIIGDYVQTNNGKEIIYLAQDSDATNNVTAFQTIMKLDLETDNITICNLANAQDSANFATAGVATEHPRLALDEKGCLWVSDSDAAAAGNTYTLRRLNTEKMTLDSGGAGSTWAGATVTLQAKRSNFSVHEDHVYYINSSEALVKKNLKNGSETKVLISNVTTATASGGIGMAVDYPYALSPDGKFLAFTVQDTATPDYGTMRVVNTETGKYSDIDLGSRRSSISSLDWDFNNRLYYIDTGNASDANALKRIDVFSGDTPTLKSPEIIRQGVPGEFGATSAANAGIYNLGLSARGYSPAANYTFQIGPDYNMEFESASADIRLCMLGISDTHVSTMEGARAAINQIKTAVDKVVDQRTTISAHLKRLEFIAEGNDAYINNLSATESRIRSVDAAKESSQLAQHEVAHMGSIAMLGKEKQLMQANIQFYQQQ